MRNLVMLAALALGSLSFQVVADPVGEVADYKLDRDMNRTSSVIKQGVFKAEVTDYLPDQETGPAYKIQIDYDVLIQFYGRRTGTEYVDSPEEFFTPEFMQNLRDAGEIHYPQFKIRQLG